MWTLGKPEEEPVSSIKILKQTLPDPVEEEKHKPPDAPPAVPRGEDADGNKGAYHPGDAEDALGIVLEAQWI